MGVMTALTAAERILKNDIERRIRDSIDKGKACHFAIGECLDMIIERRLYRDSHASFEAYCESSWGFSGSIGRKAANTYRVAQTLQNAEKQAPEIYWEILTGLQPGHAEKLRQLPEEVQPIAWQEARRETSTPSVNAVEEVVAKFKDRLAQLPNMTAGEESEFNAEVEAAVSEAHQTGAVKELARLSAKRCRSVCRGMSGEYKSQFEDALSLLQQAAAALDRLAT